MPLINALGKGGRKEVEIELEKEREENKHGAQRSESSG